MAITVSAVQLRDRFTVESALFVLGVTKPDATNTGVPPGTVLTDVAAATTYSIPGQTITGMRFLNYVYVRAANVTFRNCMFVGPASSAFVTYGLMDCRDVSAQNVLIDRCTFAGVEKGMYWCNGVSGRNGASVTVNRCDISAATDAMNFSGAALTATGNYVHGLYFSNNSTDHASDAYHPYWTHNDGIQIQGGSGPFVVRGNNFSTYAQLGTDDGVHGLPSTDLATGSWDRRYGCGITPSPDSGQVTNLTVQQNWFDGGTANFQLSTPSEVGANLGDISDNRFGMDQYDYGSGSRYQIRYKAGINITGLTTNYFDPASPEVQAAGKGGLFFSVGTFTGIRLD